MINETPFTVGALRLNWIFIWIEWPSQVDKELIISLIEELGTFHSVIACDGILITWAEVDQASLKTDCSLPSTEANNQYNWE